MSRALAVWMVLGMASLAEAQAPPAEPAPLNLTWKAGPAKIDLGHELDLALPDDYVFLGMPDADKLLKKLGSLHNEDTLGVVASKDEQQDWFVVIRYEDEGYVKDDEKIDAGELLKAIREGTDEANKERQEQGFAPLTIDGWSEPPKYERDVHHLVWALLVSSKNGSSVNFNTRVLGRKGFVSLNLVTDPGKLAGDRPHAAKLLQATAFRAGARYEDYKKGDKTAEYGLVGLILGGVGVAKLVKLGLLAKFWKVILAVLIAGKKALVLFFVGIGAWFKRVLGKKQASPQVSTTAGAAPPPPGGESQQPPLPPTGTDPPPDA